MTGCHWYAFNAICISLYSDGCLGSLGVTGMPLMLYISLYSGGCLVTGCHWYACNAIYFSSFRWLFGELGCHWYAFNAMYFSSFRWVFGELGCHWYAFNGLLFGFASIGMLTVISIDRYISICRRDIGE